MSAASYDNWQPLFPFRARFMDAGGSRYHYVDVGEGAPVLFVHGNPTWSFYWRNLAKPLRDERVCRVIMPDHIGCGLSDKPHGYPYTIRQHIDNLRGLIERLDLRDITLVAHDWGGAIGLGAAVRHPDRFRKLVLLNTGAFPPPYIPFRLRLCRLPLFGRFAVQGLNMFARGALRMAVNRPERLTNEVRMGYLAPYDCWAHRIAIYQFLREIPVRQSHPNWKLLQEIEAGLQQFKDREVMMFWGMRDWCFNEVCLQRFESIFPQAEVHRFADAGHYVVEDAHEDILPRLREFVSTRTS